MSNIEIWQWYKGSIKVYSENHDFTRQLKTWGGVTEHGTYFQNEVKIAVDMIMPLRKLKKVLQCAQARGYEGDTRPMLRNGEVRKLYLNKEHSTIRSASSERQRAAGR